MPPVFEVFIHFRDVPTCPFFIPKTGFCTYFAFTTNSLGKSPMTTFSINLTINKKQDCYIFLKSTILGIANTKKIERCIDWRNKI